MAPRSHHYSPPLLHSGPRLLPGPLPFLGALPWIAHSPATPFRELAPTTREHELWIVWIERYPAIFPSFCPLYFFCGLRRAEPLWFLVQTTRARSTPSMRAGRTWKENGTTPATSQNLW